LEGVSSSTVVGQIVITDNDDKWIVLPRGHDLFVVKGDGTDSKELKSTSVFNSSDGPVPVRHNDIRSIAIDKEGAIWLGTTKGVTYYSNPDDVWDENPYYSYQPGLDLNDGIYHPLLETETVTAIAINGANQKWFGTENSGVFLISEDGEKELEHFTESNSPLLSNNITGIVINPKGEVFIGTDEGLISYKGLATEGSSSYADVYAYPNPVRETYEGDIIITGLKEETSLKITDISGNLVYETESQGGQAAWNGKNLYGNRVSTGIYLVMGNDRLGEETFVTKILFIH
jgi:sugar lactone lactonase YvrE